MRMLFRVVLGLVAVSAAATAQSSPPEASAKPAVGTRSCEAVLHALRTLSEDAILELTETKLSDSRQFPEQRLRFTKRDDQERIEWWRNPEDARAGSAETAELLATLPSRTLSYDGFRQVDWHLGRSKRAPDGRILDRHVTCWIAITSVTPELAKERPRFLRAVGLTRLGNWLWEPCPDGRTLTLKMLRPNLLLVAAPVGDPEEHTGLVACELWFLDESNLPKRIIEHVPTQRPIKELDEAALESLASSEIVVEGRFASGMPRCVRHTHHSEDLLNFAWTCNAAEPVAADLRESLADSSICPVLDTDLPIERADSMISMMKDGPVKPRVADDVPGTSVQAKLDVGFLGLLLAACGVVLAVVRRVFPAAGAPASGGASEDLQTTA